MPKLPQITGGELVKALQKEGFEVTRRRGSHVQLRKYVQGKKVTFPVPIHQGMTLKSGTLRGILRLAGVPIEHLITLLSGRF